MSIFTDEQLAKMKRDNDEALGDAFRRATAEGAKTAARMRNIDNAVHQHYLAAGAPYGDTTESRWRWMNERTAEAQTHQKELNAIQREQDLADMRELGAQIRAKQFAQKVITTG